MAPRAERERIVLTGCGLVTPLGRSREEFWRNWASGRSAARPITRLDATNLPVRIACEVPDFDARKELRNRKLLRLLVPGEDLGVVAAQAAMDEAALADSRTYDPARQGVILGIRKEGFRNSNLYDALQAARRDDGTIDRRVFIEDGMRRIPPQTIVEGLANAGLYHLAHEHGFQGINSNLLSLGPGGLMALGEALWALRGPQVDMLLAGSFDSWLIWTGICHQHMVGVPSTSTDSPETVFRPFDATRTGAVLGEGAAMYTVERLTAARERQAPILAELLGYGMATAVPSAEESAHVEALTAAIHRALEVAGVAPADLDLIHLHGDATRAGDRIECQAVLRALGTHGTSVPATTVKSATGFMANASSAIEVAAVVEMLRRGELLPIVNLRQPDPELPLNLVRERRGGLSLSRALLLSRGLLGHYAALLIGAVPEGTPGAASG